MPFKNILKYKKVGAAVALIIATGACAAYLTRPARIRSLITMPEEPSVRIAQTVIPIEVARTSDEVQKGLSGRPSLPENAGMLFVFKNPAKYRFWMPDMNFPLDILWIHEGKVVGIEKNVPPLIDRAHPKFYTPQKPVRFVLEVNAGFTEKNNIHVGDPVILYYTEQE